MDTTYQPQQLESRWYQIWESQGYFPPRGAGPAYCITIPPPNVTGSLHMGHGFQQTIMDALIRYQRMRGRRTLWQVGTDHAGIATQMVVERQLAAQGIKRTELGREAFLEKVWEWKAKSGGNITRQLRRMGSSPDWSRERFTMDPDFIRLVEEVFVSLYDEKLIYRGNRLVNWDPALHTAISDLEVQSQEEDGSLWHFRYPLCDGAVTAAGLPYITIATTRPETLLGDTAVAVNPNDERYQSLHGKFVELPLCGRRIPVITDDYVDPAFGTGCVKITPAHDFNDYEVGKRHDLEMINIFTIDAAINGNAPEAYQGLDRFAARKKVLTDIEALGLLEKTEPHKLKVPRGDRSGVVIEPYLTNQWYMAMKPLAEPAIRAVEEGAVEFVPKVWENTYFAWMRDIQDWCISRQLWWGHRIPAWYDSAGNIYVARSEAEVRKKYRLADSIALNQDEDVLDTWFSSALWTFVTLGWPDDKDTFSTYHPTDVLVTGFDIIFFWVARMIMMTLKFTGQIPFHKVYIHGLIRDEYGQKMTKSKGNVLDPIDLIDGIALEDLVHKRTADLMLPELARKIEKQTRDSFPQGIPAYGTDALRFTFYSLASTGRDIIFDLGRIEGHRNFCNKIWNAARYVMMNIEGKDIAEPADCMRNASVIDLWIQSRFQETVAAVHDSMAVYRFDLVSQALHSFFWDEYCDWYLELSKPILWDAEASPQQAAATRRVLLDMLEQSIRLLHPFMPFITEEIWQKVAPALGISGPTIMLQPYPEINPDRKNAGAETEVAWLKSVTLAVRNIRGEMNVSPAKTITVLLRGGSKEDQQLLERNRQFLCKLAKLGSIAWLGTEATAPVSATALHGNMEILVPLAGLIDVKAERDRLNREIAKLQNVLSGIDNKLGNAKFVANAPANVVDAERGRQTETQNSLSALQAKLQQLDQLS